MVYYKKRAKDTAHFARVAQWWSIALPRRGSRVRIPSRAFKIPFKLTANADMKRVCGFYFFLIYGWNYLFINPGVLQNENGIFCPASEIQENVGKRGFIQRF